MIVVWIKEAEGGGCLNPFLSALASSKKSVYFTAELLTFKCIISTALAFEGWHDPHNATMESQQHGGITFP